MTEASRDVLVAKLEAKVATLEKALEARSRELRRIQKEVCPIDLIVISRLLSGLPPFPRGPFDPRFWRETLELTPADVETTLKNLWHSLAPEPPSSSDPQ